MSNSSVSSSSASRSDTSATTDPGRDPGLWVLFAVTLVAVGNVSSVAPSFPQIIDVFSVSRVQVGWVVTAYSLPGIVGAPLAGGLADRLGRKPVLVPTMVVFGLAGGACALARSFPVLLVLRSVQGAAAAPLVGLAITMIGDRYDGTRRATAIGYNAAALNVGTTLYPAVGGLLAGLAWFWPFALPLLALPVAAAVAWGVAPPPVERARSLTRYVVVARRRLTDPQVLGVLGVNFGVYVLLFGAFFTYVPELLDARFGVPPEGAGLVLALTSISSGLVATQLGVLQRRVSPERLTQISLGIDAVALVLIPVASTSWGIGAAALLFGTAQGLNQPALQSRLATLASDASRGILLSLNGMVLRLGQAVGPLVMGAALVLGGLDAVFIVAAGGALLTGGAALAVLGHSY
ncbi:MAG: MFS transporter [Bacteroidetes bacterium SW_9_63_38]|nr:MAG: MFS transporter [Bacteroidetes bacterium SW_9_63_38]